MMTSRFRSFVEAVGAVALTLPIVAVAAVVGTMAHAAAAVAGSKV
ncbi:MAG TPA: hypothetical protein VJH71_01735 [Candidatus Paceibacterota bacterium]